jgi:hypothetical protein
VPGPTIDWAPFAVGEVRGYQLALLIARGDTIPVSFNAALYRDGSGTVQGIVAVARPDASKPSSTAPGA